MRRENSKGGNEREADRQRQGRTRGKVAVKTAWGNREESGERHKTGRFKRRKQERGGEAKIRSNRRITRGKQR